MIKIKRIVILIIILSFITIPVLSKEGPVKENKTELYKNTIQYYLDTGKTFSYLKSIKKSGCGLNCKNIIEKSGLIYYY